MSDTQTTQHSPLAETACSRSFITVDRAQYIAWCNGVLLDFKNGKGMAVNETEAVAADEALERGEPVLLRNGSRLMGRYLLADGDEVQEHEGFPANVKAVVRRERLGSEARRAKEAQRAALPPATGSG